MASIGKRAKQPHRVVDATRLISPTNRALLAYWQELCAERLMPMREEVQPRDIARLLPNIVILKVLREPEEDFMYMLSGSVIDDHVLQPLSGLRMKNLPVQKSPSRVWRAVLSCRDEKTPYSSGAPYEGRNESFMYCEDIFLPLASQGENLEEVTHILGSVDFMPLDDLNEHAEQES